MAKERKEAIPFLGGGGKLPSRFVPEGGGFFSSFPFQTNGFTYDRRIVQPASRQLGRAGNYMMYVCMWGCAKHKATFPDNGRTIFYFFYFF